MAEQDFDIKKIEWTTEELGRGGFGTVYKGFYNNRTVAVKRIPIQDVDIREEIFLKEYSHPNILKLFHAEQYDQYRQVAVFYLPFGNKFNIITCL